jgi:hypothetical protein
MLVISKEVEIFKDFYNIQFFAHILMYVGKKMQLAQSLSAERVKEIFI